LFAIQRELIYPHPLSLWERVRERAFESREKG